MSKREGSEYPPFVLGGAGLFLGGVTLQTAWPLTFRICDWHHGLFMLAIGFALFGYGLGARAAQRARDERDAADEREKRVTAMYQALEALVAKSLRKGGS